MEGWERDRRQRNAGGAVAVVAYSINNLDAWIAIFWGISPSAIQINNSIGLSNVKNSASLINKNEGIYSEYIWHNLGFTFLLYSYSIYEFCI